MPSFYVKAFQIRDPCFGQLFVPRHWGPFAHPPPTHPRTHPNPWLESCVGSSSIKIPRMVAVADMTRSVDEMGLPQGHALAKHRVPAPLCT